jgi:hypothetical protein
VALTTSTYADGVTAVLQTTRRKGATSCAP